MVIRISPDIETALDREARRRGTTAERLALDSLGKLFLHTPTEGSSKDACLFDFLSGHIGVVEGTGEPYSEKCGERFAEGIAVKHKQGRP
jgi:hypothetical protein